MREGALRVEAGFGGDGLVSGGGNGGRAPLVLRAAPAAAAMSGRLLSGPGDRVIGGVSIDSRTLAAGDLFFAIRGERVDGHQFAAAAVRQGAAGVVVAEAPAGLEAGDGRPAPTVIQVADTTGALQALARHVRIASGARVVAITGSAGKTTTKEVMAEFLGARYRVIRNRGNLNNHIGLPLSLLELRTRPDWAVVELGMNHAGEIRSLVAIAEPDVRVWVNVGDAHLGFFASPEAIADAKAEILEGAGPAGVLVANADDPRVTARVGGFAGRLITFGFSAGADVRARDVRDRGVEGTESRLETPAGTADLHVPLPGRGNLANVLAAAAVALEAGIPIEEVADRAARLQPAPRRGEVIRLPGGVTLVDDSYNSSPAALRVALETLGRSTGCARRVGCLGEMLELGAHATRLHEACGRAAAAVPLQWLVAVGGAAARALAAAAVAAGMPAGTVVHVATSEEAAALAVERARAGDLVLVKGSRGIRMELVADRLKEEFA